MINESIKGESVTTDTKENGVMVSVHMITYKHEKFIAEAIEGVLSQKTNFLVELIISDDCSPDKTREIIETYRVKYPSVIKPVARDKNLGMMKNFADTFRYCTGKYIAVCEGDDCWTDPLKLQKQVDFLEAHTEYAMCFHNARIVDVEKGTETLFLDQHEDRSYSGSEILMVWTIPTASVVFRNHCFSIAELENPNYRNGDIVLFLSIADHGKLWYKSDVMSRYNRHTGGVTYTRKTRKDFERYIANYTEMSRSFGGKYKNETKTLIGLQYMFLSLESLRSFSPGFFANFWKSFQSYPSKFFRNFKVVYLNPVIRRLS